MFACPRHQRDSTPNGMCIMPRTAKCSRVLASILSLSLTTGGISDSKR